MSNFIKIKLRVFLHLIDRTNKFLVQKRSDKKEYCPGYLDLTFGGLVGIQEADKETEVIILILFFIGS